MTNNRAYRAMEFIGDDLILRAEMDYGAIARRPAAVWTKGIAVAASLALVVGGACYAGIGYWNGTWGRQHIGGYDYAPTMKQEYWYYNDTSFAKLKIDEIVDENLYQFAPPICHRVILLKCTILEDYYGTHESGTQVVLPIRVPAGKDKGDFLAKYREKVSPEGVVEWDELHDVDWKGEGVYVDVQTVMDFFAGFDTIFAYFYGPYFGKSPRPITLQTFYSDDTGETTERDYCSAIDMYSDSIFFISDGKVDFRSIDLFLERWNVSHRYIEAYDFDDYVWDGMDEDEFSANIRCLKEEILEQGDFNAGVLHSCIRYDEDLTDE